MKATAVTQASERLSRAARAVQELEAAVDFVTSETAWSNFLLAAGGIYSKLEQGSKGCNRSEGWFGRKKHERRTDEVLRYLHHARNADEHGITGTNLQFTEVKILNDKVRDLKVEVDAAGNSKIVPIGEGAEIETLQRYTALKGVLDRTGNMIMPPGYVASSAALVSAAKVARSGLALLELIIAEARQLPTHN